MSLAISVNLDNSLLTCCCCFLCHNSSALFSCFLLVCNSFLLTLSSAGIVLGALTAYRKTVTMADTPVATDIHQTFDVHLNSRTELTFDLILLSDDASDFGNLLVVPFTDLSVE